MREKEQVEENNFKSFINYFLSIDTHLLYIPTQNKGFVALMVTFLHLLIRTTSGIQCYGLLVCLNLETRLISVFLLCPQRCTTKKKAGAAVCPRTKTETEEKPGAGSPPSL